MEECRDLDYSPDGKTLASVISRQVVLWDIENKTEKLIINDVNGQYVKYSQTVRRLYAAMLYMTQQQENQNYYFLTGEGYRDFVVYSPDGETIVGQDQKEFVFGIQIKKNHLQIRCL